MTEYLPTMETEKRSTALSMWFTPPELAKRIAQWAIGSRTHRQLTVLEPSAGDGALVTPLALSGCRVVAIDIDETNVQKLLRSGAEGVIKADFLTWDNGGPQFDMVCMNPPFENGAAEAHILHALKFAPSVVAHVPLTTLEGKKRREGLWSLAYLKRLAICSSRPKYGEKAGATAMCTIDVVRRPEGKLAMNGRVACSGVEIEWWI